MRWPGTCLRLVVALLVGAPVGLSHDGLHEQIDRTSRLLEERPGDVELLLRRSELYRLHGDPEAAEADLERAACLDPGSEEIPLARGRLLVDQERWGEAEAALRRAVAIHPRDGTARLLLARSLAAQESWEAAESEYREALDLGTGPWPEHYLALARVIAQRGAEHRARALAVLEEGLRRLGTVPSLVLAAVDLERELGRPDAALERLDGIERASPRKEQWLALRGEILRQAGREGEAQQAFHTALEAIARLPPRLRRTQAVVELESRLECSLRSPAEGQQEEQQ